MPSGFTADLPDDVLLDAGVLSVAGAVVGVSRGGLEASTGVERRNVEFDNKRAPVAGFDRVTGVVARFSGTFLQFGAADVQRFEALGTGSGFAYALAQATAYAVAQATAYAYSASALGLAPHASTLYAAGQYLTNVRVTYARGDGGTCAVLFPLAQCVEWSLSGQDKNEGEVRATFEARQDLTSSTDTDALPYRIEVTPAA